MCICVWCFDVINETDRCTALICLILNIFLPGFGTMLNGCCGAKCPIAILVGILQILLIPVLLIGWVWSILYGLEIYRRSGDHVHHHHHYHKSDH